MPRWSDIVMYVRVFSRGGQRIWLLAAFVCTACFTGCGSRSSEWEPPAQLSELGLFTGNGSTQEPAEGVVPYDLTTPLFSDYASKYRVIKLPEGASATYDAEDSFAFPVGTLIGKTFAYPADMRDPAKGERLLETRVLFHRPEGWVGFAYVWNDDQTDATLKIAGATMDVSWIHQDGQERSLEYLVPNANQCKGCHKWKDNKFLPIGPKARYLNKDFVYKDKTENQLVHWTRLGALSGAPEPEEAPRLAVWDDESSGTVEERARAWMEVNCAHCHNPLGPARNSGLDLMASQHDPFKYGVFKPPVAAGRGSAGSIYGIVPGKPDESILIHRIESTKLDVMMPELGRRTVHEEGVALVRDWIAQMPTSDDAASLE